VEKDGVTGYILTKNVVDLAAADGYNDMADAQFTGTADKALTIRQTQSKSALRMQALEAGETVYITQLGDTMIMAHRAGRRLFPQGTMMAFEGCINSKTFETDIFEFDVRLTKDEKLIILHDDTLDEVSNAVEYFGKTDNHPEDYTYDELYNLNMGEFFKNADGEMIYSGLRGDDIPYNLRVLTANDAISCVEENGDYYYSIEIKIDGEAGFKAADILYGILSDMKLLDRVIVASFSKDVILYIEENYPDLTRTAYNVEAALLFFDALLGIDRPEGYYEFDVLQVPPDRYIVNMGTSRLVNHAHKNNIAVCYWTINDEEKMMLLHSIGADGIITDVPDTAYEILKTQNNK
jgi:glycerophosphoryl diester phosphodiesterase